MVAGPRNHVKAAAAIACGLFHFRGRHFELACRQPRRWWVSGAALPMPPRNQLHLDREVAAFWRPLVRGGAPLSCGRFGRRWEEDLRVYPVDMRTFNVVIERDPDTGLFVGYVPGWPGAHSQGESLDELQVNLQEVVSMLLEDGEPKLESEFVAVQTIRVA
jgi:predicted RNase H-like HicB family nuclease